MGLLRFFFSFNGRVNRTKFWLFALFVGIIRQCAAGLSEPRLLIDIAGSSLLYVAVAIFLFWSTLALGTKRLQDRDKSGAWILFFIGLPYVFWFGAEVTGDFPVGGISSIQVFRDYYPHLNATSLPFVIGFLVCAIAIYSWGFVELFCLRGTIGDNGYGPDPLAKSSSRSSSST